LKTFLNINNHTTNDVFEFLFGITDHKSLMDDIFNLIKEVIRF
jgi:hypothetical protein